MALTPATERLRELMTTADGQKAAIEWIGNPFTQDMLAAARERSRPMRPRTNDALDVAMSLGETAGANAVLDFLSQPNYALTETKKDGGMPRPLYGAKTVLMKERTI